ncbi:MAG: glycosyltransferase family 87 protein [Candidatus Promineifilaceae bacterium]
MSQERRFPGREHWQLWLAVAAFCAAAVWFYGQVLWPSATNLTHGFGAYYSASRLLSNGDISADIYDPAYFRPIVRADSGGAADDIFNANPPTTTIMFLPLSFLPIEQARMVWTVMGTIFLALGLGLLLWGFGVPFQTPNQRTLWFIVMTLALLFQPVIQNFLWGQAYVLVFFLSSVTTAAFFKAQASDQPNHKIESAGGIALAASLLLKTAGWPLLILFLWLRKWRFLAWIIGFGAVVFLATLPIFRLEMWQVYGRLLSEVSSSPMNCVPAYQTTRSLLCHLFAPNVYWQDAAAAGIKIPDLVTGTYFVLGIGCILGLLRLARKRPNAAFVGFVCWSILFLPLGEVHQHTVLLIPLVWLIVKWSEHGRFGRTALLLAVVCYLIPFPMNAPQFQSGMLALLAYPYVAGAWLIFLGILWDHKSEILPGWG